MNNIAGRLKNRKRCNSISLFFLLLLIISLDVSLGSENMNTRLNIIQESGAAKDKRQESDDGELPKKKVKKDTLSGNIGAGVSMTSGNSNTINWNMSFAVNKQTGRGHNFRGNGLYLRGQENGKLSVNRLTLAFRDDYSINSSIVGFGNISYKKDPLKGINYLVNPMGGLGWKIKDGEKIFLQVDAGAGVVTEQNNGMISRTSASINSSQRFTYEFSDTASLNQKLDILWKAGDLKDYLVNLSISLATKVTNASELQVEFLDDFKNKPSDILYKKNDIALILKYVVRF
jgi:putative salt-induced outer membrane protein YdiY